MHLSKLCASAAVVSLASATAAIGAATQVTITDPNATTRAAHVEPGNRLAVQEVPPANFYNSYAATTSTGNCATIAIAPTGKALIVRQVRVDIVSPSTGGEAGVFQGKGSDCGFDTLFIGTVSSATIGLNTITFDPGFVVQAGGSLGVGVNYGVIARFFLDGYLVPSAASPPPVGPTFHMFTRPLPLQR